MYDQAQRLRELAQNVKCGQVNLPVAGEVGNKTARIIAVTSGKGGVGKTNFSANIAIAMAIAGQKVIVIDADIGMANLDVILGCSAPYNLTHLMENACTIDEVLADGPQGVKFLSGISGIRHLADLTETQLKFITAQFNLLDRWADMIILDTGAGMSRNVLNFLFTADETIIITTPEPTAITDAYAMIKVYASQCGNPLKLVVNRVQDAAEGEAVAEKLSVVSQRFLDITIEYLGFIYEDPSVSQAVKFQNPFVLAYPRTRATQCIFQIARRVIDEKTSLEPGMHKGLFQRFMENLW